MLGRSASDLFWLSRYVERAESMARLVEVGSRIALRPREGDGHHEEWRDRLATSEIGEIFRGGLHEFLLEFIARNHALGDTVSTDYHFFD